MIDFSENQTGSRGPVLIFNPVSGTEDPSVRRCRIEKLASGAGLRLLETDEQRGAAPAARAALDAGVERVLVAGGDGTVAEVAGVLAGTGIAMAVVPGGTGNLLAVNLGLPADAAEAIRIGLHAEAFPTDMGRANGKAFLVNAGIGFDAHLIHEADRALKDRFGPLAYFIAAWRNRSRTRTTYTLRIDRVRLRRRAHMVMVANLGRITGGMELISGSAPEDGRLQVGILSARGILNLARVGIAVILGNRQRANLFEVRTGESISIEAGRPQPIQFDGNDAGKARVLEITIEPGALQLVRPALLKGAPAPAPPVPLAISRVKRWVLPVASLSALVLVCGTLIYRRIHGNREA